MADGRDPTPAFSFRTALSWTNIFRCFQVALDPRKLLVAAAGILVMSILWYVLSYVFWYKAPLRTAPAYDNSTILKDTPTTRIDALVKEEKARPGAETDENKLRERAAERIGDERHRADLEQWRVLDSLAGEGGRLRTMPWDEYRGPNPFLFVTDLLGSPAALWWGMVRDYLATVTPVLIEPLVKLLLPVAKMISPGASPWTRFYLFLVLLSNIAVWAFAGRVITRIAAVQLANKGPISLKQAVRFVWNRYVGYLGAPLAPIVIVGVCVLGLILYGVLGLIPFVGDVVVLGLGLPVVIVAGVVMAIFLVGLVGYPLMYTTLSAEGDQSDTFDALSRSINYVYQAPWQYIWYWVVAILYGAAVTLFVLFFTCLAVYVGKWAVGLPASLVWSDRKPEYLFIYAPESFGWRALLTKDSPYAVRETLVLMKDGKEFGNASDAARTVMFDKTGKETTNPAEAVRTVTLDRFGRETINLAEADRVIVRFRPVDQAAFDHNRNEFWAYNTWGAGIVAFWLTLIFLMMLGFTYSFFWSAATMIYLLMRKQVDEAELDEVFVEEEEPEPPLAPPKIAEGTGPNAPTSLPVIAPPPVPVAPPVVPPPPPPPVMVSPPPPPPVMVSPPPPVLVSPPPPPPPKAEEPKKVDDDDVPLG